MTQVVLRQHDGRWIVKVHELERVFADEMEAMNCAVQLAHDSGKNGSPSMVLLHADDATFREIWTYGKDAFPLTSASSENAAASTSLGQER